jgi:N-acetylglutamate synthase-like GNAT family acetyltransferase
VEIAPGLGHLRHFGTHREWNGRGIGRRIYAVCEAEARSAGVRAFEVWASLNAAPFYQSLGFARIERITIDFAPGVAFPSLVMRRAL